MVLLRQGQQGFGQQGDFLHPHGHLPPLGAEHHALYAQNVADVEFLEPVILFLIHLVLAGVELDAAGAVLQVAEGHLPHAPLGHHPPGDGHRLALQGVEIGLDVGAVVVRLVLCDLEGVAAALLQLLQLIPADAQDLPEVLLPLRLGPVCLIFRHILRSFPPLPRGTP